MDIKEMVKRQVLTLGIAVDYLNKKELTTFEREVINSTRIFIAGCGRSKLSLLGFAMRLMHLGKEVYIVGDVTTPAFRNGDTLFVASASGSRESLVHIGRKAKEYGGKVNLFTTKNQSQMSQYADNILVIPVDEIRANKEFKEKGIDQNGGNIFEEMILVLTDSIVEHIAGKTNVPRRQLMELHANFE